MGHNKDDISSMITDYINGRLSAADRALVETAITHDDELAADLEFQRLLSESLKNGANSDQFNEMGWARLEGSISELSDLDGQTDSPHTPPIATKTSIGWPPARLGPQNTLPPQAANDSFIGSKVSHLWKYAALLAAALVVGQAGIIGSKYVSSSHTPAQKEFVQEGYFTASKPSKAAFNLKIAFVPSAQEKDIRTLLRQSKATLSSGPSALGLYEVSFKTEADKTNALEHLAQLTDIIESVTQ